METFFILALSMWGGKVAFDCFRIGTDQGKFWGWLNLICSAANFAVFLNRVI